MMVQYLVLKVITIFIQLFPLNIIRLFKYPFGFLYYILSVKSTIRLIRRKKYFKTNKLFDFSPLVTKIFYTQYWLETLWLNKKISEDPNKYVSIIDVEKINDIKSNNEGFIIALPHQGNWEFAIPAGQNIGLNLVAVAEPLKNKKILDWFIKLRTSLGCKIILGGTQSNTYSQILEEIQLGKAVCLVAERHVMKSGAPTEFFGKIAAFPTGPVNLALDTGCPIIPTTCISTRKGFEIYFGNPFYVPKFGDNAQSIQHGLKTLAKEFEYLIGLAPNQWHSTVSIWSDE